MFNPDIILEIFQEYYSIAIVLSLAMSIIIAIIGILPSIFVTGANIIFFGPINGFLISLLGEVVGGYITFLIYRKGLKKGTEQLFDKYKLINKLVNSEGKKAGLLIFEGRLLPFMPSGLVTLAAALSNVNSIIYILATLLGKIPSIALEVLISYQVINIKENILNLFITLIVLVLILITIKFYKE